MYVCNTCSLEREMMGASIETRAFFWLESDESRYSQPRIYVCIYIYIAGEFGLDGDCLPIS